MNSKKKVAIIADVHYVHTYHDNYDKVKEFDSFIDQLMDESPVAIISLGDIVDQKYYNQGRLIPYRDGARHQFPFVETVKRTRIPWYQLLGNHDDHNIFKSIQQATGNLFLRATDPSAMQMGNTSDSQKPLEIGNILFWFVQLEIKWPEQQKVQALQEIFQVKSKYGEKNSKHILLLHVDVIRRGELVGFSPKTIEMISKNFDLTICGHEHEFKAIGKSKKVICAPAALPTGVKKSSNPLRAYDFHDNILQVKRDWNQPFGYLLLDTEGDDLSIQFKPFDPCAGTIEINYDISGKGSDVVLKEWSNILEEIKVSVVDSKKLSMVVVIPVISGRMERLTTLTLKKDLKTVAGNINCVFVADPRFEKIVIDTYSLEEEGNLPEISKDAVMARTLQQATEVVKELKKRGITIDVKIINSMIKLMVDSDVEFFKKKGTQKDITVSMVNNLADLLNDGFDLDITELKITTVINKAFS